MDGASVSSYSGRKAARALLVLRSFCRVYILQMYFITRRNARFNFPLRYNHPSIFAYVTFTRRKHKHLRSAEQCVI